MGTYDRAKARRQNRPSILWLIEHAPTIGMLEEFVAMALGVKDPNPKTRKQWIEAVELRKFYLERRPPTFEKIGVAEAFGEEAAMDPRLKMSVEDVIQQVLDTRHFKCAEDGLFAFSGMVEPEPLAKYFSRHLANPPLEGNQTDQTHPLAEGETACKNCKGLGWISVPGAAFDPPAQEPCPNCEQ